MKKCVATFLAIVMACTVFQVGAFAEAAAPEGSVQTALLATTDYDKYLQANNALNDAKSNIEIPVDSYTANSGAVVSAPEEKADENGTVKTAIKWEKEKGSLTYTIDVAEGGFYNVMLSYLPIEGRGLPLTFAINVDNAEALPYEALKNLNFDRTWVDVSRGGVEADGNIYASEQKELFVYRTGYAMDKTGQYTDPLKIALTAGTHTITLTASSGEFYLAGITLAAPKVIPTYEQKKAEYEAAGYQKYTGDEEILIEGELADEKTTSSMTPLIDNSDPSVSSLGKDSEPFKEKINYIGATSWQTPGETITWKINAPADGLYKVGFRFRQNGVINGNSYREMRIDGEIPFAEAKQVPFYYAGGWQFSTLNVNGEDAYVYLTKGEHTLSLGVTLGSFGEVSREINSVTGEIGKMYLNIRMITGENIDTGRSYVFFEQIPNFNEDLLANIQRLEALCVRIAEITGETSGTYIANIRNMIRVMQEMYDNPYTSQKYISTYYDNYCTLCAMIADLAKLPLDIDQIVLAAPDKEFGRELAGFWAKTVYSFDRFLVSFMSDYRYTTESDEGKETLTLWVTWGRDQTQVLTALVKDSFEREHPNVNVNIQIVGATLVQAILLGEGPDLLLGQVRSEPVNYGMRGALIDLKGTFGEDFENHVAENFQKDAAKPYQLGEAVYGIPDTQNFNIMYYRTDVLAEMGLDIEKMRTGAYSWDDFRNDTALLQRQNLGVGLPGVGEMSWYSTYLRQRGLSLYTPDLKATAVGQGDAVSTFVYWTEFYTNLGYETAFEFYNRFRAGTMPLGLGAYSQYVTFSEAAPEITGKWGIAPIPGTLKEDGSVDRTQSDSGTACVIPTIAHNVDLSWEFLKWWTSENTQYRYSMMVESILGEVGRVATANVEALSKLPWQSGDLQVLQTAWSEVDPLEEVPGGYYVQRSIYQAFWNVVNLDENPKDMIVKWGKIADKEIERKRGEYNLD